jgi:hypothetical protein
VAGIDEITYKNAIRCLKQYFSASLTEGFSTTAQSFLELYKENKRLLFDEDKIKALNDKEYRYACLSVWFERIKN